MYRNLIVLPDGTEIFSGLGAEHTIQNTTLTSSSNNGAELSPGAVCADSLEAKLFTPRGNLNITVGTEITLYKVDDSGNRIKAGLFTLDKPERPSRNTYKIMAYDRASWLDRDITDWLASLDGWPYSLLTLAQMVCDKCLLNLITTEIPNGNFPVNKFPASKMTGRELMGHIGELAGRFCRATPDGDIEFAWYTDSGITLEPSSERYFFSLKYEDYQVEKIEAVQVQLADGEYGSLWPEADPSANSYIISGNPLITAVNNDLKPYLDVLQAEIEYSVYSPCRITVPVSLDIRPGHILRIVDADGRQIQTYVMTKTQKGQKETLESTGNVRRSKPTPADKTVADYVDAALKRQTATEIFNRLTNYGAIQGLFMEENGQIYVNAAYISTGILQSKNGSTFYLDLDEGILKMDARELTIAGRSLGEAALSDLTQEEIIERLTNGGFAEGIYLQNGQLYINAEYIVSGTLNASLIKAGVLESQDGGKTFRLDLENGTFSMEGTGKFMAPDGNSYITLDGTDFILHTRDGEDSDFVDIARIGFSQDSEGKDYPYVLLGHAEEDGSNYAQLGLLKMFSNGIYIGNSAPKNATGAFIGMQGASGMFVNTIIPKTYMVTGTQMDDTFVAVFG